MTTGIDGYIINIGILFIKVQRSLQEKGWKNGVLKIRAGFLLRKMMNGHVVVAVGEAGESFNGMICLNEAGVFLWQQMEKGIEKSALIEAMLERYEDLEQSTAEEDLQEFLQTVSFAMESEA